MKKIPNDEMPRAVEGPCGGGGVRGAAGLFAMAWLAVAGWSGVAIGAPAGELDATFADHGRLEGEYPFLVGLAVLQQPADGKLVVAAQNRWDTLGGGGDAGAVIYRLHADGTADPGFVADGAFGFGRPHDTVLAMALTSDRKILLAGYANTSPTAIPDYDLVLARLHADGSPDTGFASGGYASVDFGGMLDYAAGMAVLPNGDIVVAGASDRTGNLDPVFAKFRSDGSLDAMFGNGPVAGTTRVDAGRDEDLVLSLVALPDGGFVACGQGGPNRYDGAAGHLLATRINADGTVDGNFGIAGTARLPSGAPRTAGQACAAMPDGAIVIAGYSGEPGAEDLLLARLLPDGRLDTTFGAAGLSVIDLGGADVAQALIRLADGTLGVTGLTAATGAAALPRGWPIYPWRYPDHLPVALMSDLFIARVDARTGSLDPSFGNAGVTIVDFGAWDRDATAYGRGLIEQPDGKLVAVGTTETFYWGSTAAVALARVDAAGAGHAGVVGFAATRASVAEGDGVVVASVRRTGGSTGPLSVDYRTADSDWAKSPADFTALSGTLSWEHGDIEPKLISVPITNDADHEPSEAFHIELLNSTGGLAARRLTVVIRDDDAAPPRPAVTFGPQVPADVPASGGGAVGYGLLLSLLGIVLLRRRRADIRWCAGRARGIY